MKKHPVRSRSNGRSYDQHRSEHAKISKESDKKEFAFTLHEEDPEDALTEWHLDSACTSHMTPDETWLVNKKVENKIISVAEEGRNIESICRGELKTITMDEASKNVKLKNVLCVPKLRCNLLSVPSMVKSGNEVVLNEKGAFIYSEDGELICTGKLKENMFIVNLTPRKSESEDEACFQTNANTYEIWHRRLGHVNFEYLKSMLSKQMVRGLEKLEGKIEICDSCIKGKMTRRPYENSYSETTKDPLEHIDLCGPMKITSLGGKKYILTVVDQFTRRYFVEFIKTKDEVPGVLQKLINKRENELNSTVQRIRSDNGSEFINDITKQYFEHKGIKHERTVCYSPRSNGTAERANRTLLDKARTLLIDSALPLDFWAEAVSTAEYMHNITPTKSKDKTPMELWNGKKPSVRHVKPFGCVAFYKVFHNKRHKLQPKSKKGVFVGYSRNRKAYRIYDIEERQIHETSDVIEYIWSNPENQQTDEPTNQPVIQERIDGTVSTEINDDLTTDDEEDGNQNISNRPVRNRRLPSRYEDYEVYAVSDATPETYEDAAVSQEKDKWKDAMDKEINSFEMHNVWEEVERPQNKKVIKSRWVYKIKELDDEKLYKARLVGVGCGQRQGIDFEESFTPIMKWDSLRILLKIAAMKKSVVKFFDVKTAYLNGILNEELYMEPPKGYELRSNKVFKINKSIYGLPQSGRCWYNKFSEILAQAG
ncbi:Retrovirus-related Pol polyprotein from transposon TNT 1-94 [Araneus ventricosus]|uniref:Retrovirus-related Pol polyprotein from transposon TNT 1-94 n=1 Tax=Araneus ventricosus TaxID=182803 RepID=A0A4Y2VEF9_ARAVE|nr:Retrovirus-related Pol polyprotein from transposon TNT 1-94 [Araneus ventricosus]